MNLFQLLALRFLSLSFGAGGWQRTPVARAVDCFCEVPMAVSFVD
jgi:hypothetical protein